MHDITEAGSVRASQWLQREHAEDTVSHLAGPGCLISQNLIKNTLNTSLCGQTSRRVPGFIRSKSDEARNRIH